MKFLLLPLVVLLSSILCTLGQTDTLEPEHGQTGMYKIEGKVTPPDQLPSNWLSKTSVTIDGGRRRAFLKEDNSFVFQVDLVKPSRTIFIVNSALFSFY